jgi:hypothetical protein
VRFWAVEYDVMKGWRAQMRPDTDLAGQDRFWNWVRDNVDYGVVAAPKTLTPIRRGARDQASGATERRRQRVHDIPTAKMVATLNRPSHEIVARFSIGSQPQLATSQ